MSSSYQVNYTGAQVEAAIEKALELYTNSQIDNFLLQKVNTTDVAAVALSGSYNDLLNKPDIPAAQIQSDWNQSDESALDFIKNKPTIPSGLTVDQIYDPTSTNAQSGVAIAGAGFLTEHQSLAGYVPTARTINGKALTSNITLTASDVGALPSDTAIPTKVSDLTNDSGFITGVAWGDVTDKPSTFTPASHNQASSTINALTNYSKAVTGGTGALATSDTLNKALAKLENALDGKQASGSYADASHTHTKSEITDFPTIPTVNNKTVTIQKNGTTVDSFTLNQSSNKTINITVPTSAADVSALPSSTKYAASMDLSVDPDTFVITAQLKDQDGNNLGTAKTIDLPLESVVVSGSYNTSTKKVVLTLKDGSTVEFSIADLVSGLQTEITSTNKLSADLIKDGTTNKVVTATEKSTWNGKQDAISDLTTIRNNASAGANAATTISGYGDIVTHDAEDFASADHTHSNYVPTSRTINSKALSANITLTASDVGALPSSTAIPTKVSDLTNDSGFVTTDTKNTAGTTNKTGTKMFLAAATSQGDNPQTFSNSNCYIGTDNCLYSGGTKVLTAHQSLSGYVPTSRTVNGKALSANITLSASDVGALPDDTVIPTKVSDLTNDAGYTTNTGTITGIKMNGASKGTSGVVDLGTVITTQYTHPTTSGNKHIPSGGSSNQVLVYSSDGTAVWGAVPSHAHSEYFAKNSIISGATDWDTLTDFGCYKIQNCTMTDEYHAPAGEYGYGLLEVYRVGTDNENRIGQTYYPHNPNSGGVLWARMQNGTSGTNWTAWKKVQQAQISKGSATQPVYFNANGNAVATTYTLGKSVPADAVFTDTVYTHPATSGNKHIPSGGSSGQFLKWSSDGTATWAADNNTLNTAGSTDTSSKIFLVGATSQAANPQTYSHDTVFVDANGRVNSAAPASDANDTTVATTKWVKDQSYVTTNTTQTISGTKTFTGNPVFTSDSFAGQLTVNRSNNATGLSVIRFTNNNTLKGCIGVQSSGNPVWVNSSNTVYNLVRNSAENTAVGSATKGVYIDASGVATAMTYELNKTVPSDAVFTDTNTLMTQNVSSTNATYPILACPTADATANQGAKTGIFASGIKINPSTNEITATTFNGTATVAKKVDGGTLNDTATADLVTVKMGSSDYFRIRAGGTGNNGGWVELATADDSNEPIYVRQYSGQFSTLTRTATLLNASGNTELPGSLSIGNGGATMQYNSTTEAIEFVFA